VKHLLSTDCLATVTRLAQERTLCAFDFDGTLAEIVDDPSRARMGARTRELLRRVAELYPCMVVSGRARQSVVEKLEGVPVERIIGNHGAEPDETLDPPPQTSPPQLSPAQASQPQDSRFLDPRPMVGQWKAVLEAGVCSIPGVWIEDKGFSLAVHYRLSTQKAAARHHILATVRSLERVHIFGGKDVINVVADGAPNKGDALAAERERLRCDWVLYVGDDENDEAAFALEGNVVAVRIGRTRHSHARYFLRTQAEIDDLLELLVRLREPQPQK
jgi:trehalose 6-phosphate phosphatase